ncbi:UNVERIFIED_CONTAM: hypothetical protein GTU68_062229, partial [Idotea baltica]|nr:hypothetical protein [Idotea baltica]
VSELLTVKDISVWRGDNLLLDEVQFDLSVGQVLQVRGANGSGKTTLLRIVCGVGFADEGSVLWRGIAIERNRHQFNNELLYLGHKPGIKGALSPLENLRIFCVLAGLEASAKTDALIIDALDNLSLSDKTELPCRFLSAGQQRRVALARLLIQHAHLWVLDEPLTSLDKAGLAWVEKQISLHVAAGGAVLLTTHAPLQVDGVTVNTLEL